MTELEMIGCRAFNKGIKEKDNPYKEGTREHAHWVEGWNYAENKATGRTDLN